MKIFILKVHPALQQESIDFKYPSHNRDFGVEQDFLIWINKNSHYLTENSKEADWHYLPVFWTRWHISHNFAANGDGLEDLEKLVKSSIIDNSKTFTITQFDGGTLLNGIKILEFTAARTENLGIDIPILCDQHRLPLFKTKKKFLASFNGSLDTHPIRRLMSERLKEKENLCIGGSLPTRFLKRIIQGKQYNLNILSSYIALCPRGTSTNSFRFFEAMQLGVAPCLIGDIDSRPFRRFIDWDKFSYYAENVNDLEKLLDNLDKTEALAKGKLAKAFFEREIYYQQWCKYVIKELDERA